MASKKGVDSTLRRGDALDKDRIISGLKKENLALQEELQAGQEELEARLEELRANYEELETQMEERKRAEKAVSAERQRFNDVLETLPAYLVLLTPDYHVSFANRFFRERFGESRGRRCFEYLFGRTEPCENCETYKVLKTGGPLRWEWTGPDGRNYDIYDFPFKDTDGSPLIMEMGIDITERKRAEAALQDMNKILERRVAERTVELQEKQEELEVQAEEIQAQAEELRANNEELERQVEVRKQAEEGLKEARAQAELYLDLMGHDISNMHQIALAQLELAQEAIAELGKLDRGDKELIDTPVETLRRSALLIDNVRKLQKLRAGEYKAETVDLGKLLADVAEENTKIPGTDVTIHYTPVNRCYVRANPLLKDVFANLLGNAIKHSNGPATINIGVEKVTDNGSASYRVTVEDEGPGIPDDKKEEVFHRFKRGQTKARGTGLGLYIVRTLVESFHGRVEVEDRVPGDHRRGSRFIVYLPALEGCYGQ